MLASLPRRVAAHPTIVVAFNRLEPLTKEKFLDAAHEFGLPEPNFLKPTAFRTRHDPDGNVWVGQYSFDSDEKSGVIRKYSANGFNLSDQVMFGNRVIGMSRHFDASGCIAEVVCDGHGKLLDVKCYDPEGEPVSTDHPSIPYSFVRWICNEK